jgi:two-component system phosphate regulon sensor histidine kinase PhoR
VFFPTKSTHILQSMNLWIISLLLILTALGFFIYAIAIILRQKRLSEIQKDFINNMTHEFKTPISAIAISADVLKEEGIVNDPERLKTYANIIADQNKKLEEHIERVLQSASLENHQIDLQIESLDLCVILQEVIMAIDARRGEGQEITLDCEKGNFTINADRIHISNMIFNLVDNALKHGGPGVKVAISCKKEGASIVLSVEDNGIGIAPKYHKKIFNRFFRVPGKQISAIKGFGLGLNYVKYVVSAHGWKIKLESNADIGAKFILKLPFPQSPDPRT